MKPLRGSPTCTYSRLPCWHYFIFFFLHHSSEGRFLIFIRDDFKNYQTGYVRRQGQFYCFRILIRGPCQCPICAQQYRVQLYQKRWVFNYEKVLSDDESRLQAADLVRRARANFQYLREQCESNGSIILKRWRKKSSEKRKALLLEVDPHMYPYQWSDIRFTEEFVNSPEQKAIARSGPLDQDPDATQGRARRPYRNICLLPYLNLESLKDDPARLLNILYNRVKYSPEQWAPFDNYLLDKQWFIGSLATAYNRNCIVMHGPDYGKLTHWESRLAHAWDIIGFPRAILVLEAQMRLSEILKAIIEKLLDGAESGKDLSTFSQALELGLRKTTDISSCIEFASIYMNQPFSAPPAFDIQSLLAISQAQVNLHADHLWLLQTDPLSLRRYSDLVLKGRHQENLTVHNQHVFVALKLMEDAMAFWTWEWILQEVQKIQIFGILSRESIRPGMPLPSEYARSLGCLEALLLSLTQRFARHIFSILPSRPGFRAKWDVQYVQRLQTLVLSQKRKDGGRRDLIELYSDDPLEFCLLTLAFTLLVPTKEEVDGDTEYRFHEPSELFAILDNHLSNAVKLGKKQDIARLDEILYNTYSDLSALHQMLSLVRLHRPRVSSVPTIEDAKKTESGKAWRYTRAGYLDQDHRVFDHKLNTENVDQKIAAQQALGNLMGEFLATAKPTGSRASQKWLDQDQAQRTASSRLWAQMRSRHRQTLERINIENYDIELDLEVLSADLAPEHILDVENERAEILAKIVAKELQKTTAEKRQSKSELQTQWGEDAQTESSVTAQEAKVKIKTRSDKTIEQPDLSLTELAISDSHEPPQITVAVSKRTLEILQSLYPKPNFEERTKNVDWASFVYAMAEVGFVAKQIHGSEYSFEPIPTCKWYGRGRIVFHKPHPEPKYEAWKLLGIGKRMGKWFGWNAETFELLEGK
jgi:hypothetical protein